MFLAMGLFGIFPLIHALWLFGISNQYLYRPFLLFLAMGTLYVVGVFVFIARFPERLFPGKFDIWFHSHQFWHLFVLSAAIVHYAFSVSLWRISHFL